MRAPQAGQESVNIYPLLLSREAALCVSQPQPLSPQPFLQAIQLWPQTCTFVQPNKTLKLTELSTLESNLGTSLVTQACSLGPTVTPNWLNREFHPTPR